MRANQNKNQTEATIAPGMDDKDELDKNATQAEINKGQYTEVTSLSLDETDPS